MRTKEEVFVESAVDQRAVALRRFTIAHMNVYMFGSHLSDWRYSNDDTGDLSRKGQNA
jgi:hypothetical protein